MSSIFFQNAHTTASRFKSYIWINLCLCAKMWTASDLVVEIGSIASLLETRLKAFSAGSQKGKEFEDGIIKNFCNKVKSLPSLTMADATQLYDAVSSSCLSNDQQRAVNDCVDEKLSNPSSASHPSPSGPVTPQLVEHLWNFLTIAEWEQVKDKNLSLVAKSNVIAKRLRLLGVKSLHEQTTGRAVAILISELTTMPEYKVIHQMVDEFKSIFHKNDTKAAPFFVKKFPEKPEQLTDMHFQHAYGDAEGENKPIQDLNPQMLQHLVAKHIPLRKDNKLLRDAAKSSATASSSKDIAPSHEAATHSFAAASQFKQMEMFYNFMKMMEQQQHGQQQGQCKVKISPTKRKALTDEPSFQPKKRHALPIMDKAAEAEEEPEAAEAAPAETNEQAATSAKASVAAPASEVSGSDFENMAFEKLRLAKNKTVPMKKPQASPSALAQKASKSSAKGPATTSPKLMKKPSSNPMHVCAGMTKLSDYKITSIDPEDLHNDFNIVGSRHWKRAFNLAIRLGGKQGEGPELCWENAAGS